MSSRRWTRIFRADPRSEVNDELAFHIEQRVHDYETRGMDPEAARQAANARLGDIAQIKAECIQMLKAERRADARREWMKFSLLDFKLGLRMLIKYPGLTLVGGLAIAFATGLGAATFALLSQLAHPVLPLEQGDRIVALQSLDATTGQEEERTLFDFAIWNRELKSVEQLGAYRTVSRNLITPDRNAAPIRMAEITATGFTVGAMAPLMGRTLLPEDERPGAPPVMVIGESLWRTRFGADPGVIGRSVHLGNFPSTVVGVMPERYGFPVNHNAWTPLRVDPESVKPRQGPEMKLFGRLASGASMDQARAELATLGQRTAASSPATHEHLRPRIVPYGASILEVSMAMFLSVSYAINGGILLFLVLVCANVATLVLARTATRESEIVVRNALGASRGRIITQLFTEALVLGAVAAALGLAAAAFGLKWGLDIFESVMEPLPFWISASLSPKAALYTAVITVLGAVVIGVIPALKVTGAGVQSHLRQGGAGGGSIRFGKLWTGVIIAQIAVTVVFVAFTASGVRDIANAKSVEAGLPTREYLSVRLAMDPEASANAAVEISDAELKDRLRITYDELERRLETDPAVKGVTFATLIPRMDHPQRRIEVDDAPVPADTIVGRRISSAVVALDYFEVVGAKLLAGRPFHSGDILADKSVIVNQAFVDKFLGGRNPIGRQVRYLDPPRDDEAWAMGGKAGPWHEIVGVVPNLGMTMGDPGEGAGLYHPAASGGAYPIHMLVHVQDQPESFAARFREVAAEVNPGLRLHNLQSLDDIQLELMTTYWFWVRLGMVAAGLVLVLSLACIYSLMSFAVARRTREIGIRIALGADRRRIVAAIFSKAFMQIGAGIALGALFLIAAAGGIHSFKMAGVLLAYILLMTAVCLLACIVPTRRALRIEPTEAMRVAD